MLETRQELQQPTTAEAALQEGNENTIEALNIDKKAWVLLERTVETMRAQQERDQARIAQLERLVATLMKANGAAADERAELDETPTTPSNDVGERETTFDRRTGRQSRSSHRHDEHEAEEAEEERERVEFEATITKHVLMDGEQKSLGMVLGGGDGVKPVYVHFLFEDGATQRQSEVQIGDVILEVNGRSVRGEKSQSNVQKLLAEAGDTVHLRLLRDSQFVTSMYESVSSSRNDRSVAMGGDAGAMSLSLGGILGPGVSPIMTPHPKPDRRMSMRHFVDTPPLAAGTPDPECRRPLLIPSTPYPNERDLPSSAQRQSQPRHVCVAARLPRKKSFMARAPVFEATEASVEKVYQEHHTRDPSAQYFMVRIEKGPSESLGMSVNGGTSTSESPGIFVAKIAEGGPVSREGSVAVGDRILAVNETNLTAATKRQAVSILKATSGSVQMLLVRGSHFTQQNA